VKIHWAYNFFFLFYPQSLKQLGANYLVLECRLQAESNHMFWFLKKLILGRLVPLGFILLT